MSDDPQYYDAERSVEYYDAQDDDRRRAAYERAHTQHFDPQDDVGCDDPDCPDVRHIENVGDDGWLRADWAQRQDDRGDAHREWVD